MSEFLFKTDNSAVSRERSLKTKGQIVILDGRALGN